MDILKLLIPVNGSDGWRRLIDSGVSLEPGAVLAKCQFRISYVVCGDVWEHTTTDHSFNFTVAAATLQQWIDALDAFTFAVIEVQVIHVLL